MFHFFYSLAARRGHLPTSTSNGHRLDSELNRLAAEMGCKGSEGSGNAPAFGETVQARLLRFPSGTCETSSKVYGIATGLTSFLSFVGTS